MKKGWEVLLRIFGRPAPEGTWLDRLAALPPFVILSAALLVFGGLSLWTLGHESPTIDEPAHLSAGYSILTTGDFRIGPEHGPLARVIAALPLALQPVRMSTDPLKWQKFRSMYFGFEFLYLDGNSPERIVRTARLAALFWGFLLLGSVYGQSRDRWGNTGGLIALVLAAGSPLLLAHAHLVTVDTSFTCLFFLSMVSWQRFLEKPRLGRALVFGVIAGGALVAKVTALVALPIFGLLFLVRLWSKTFSPDPFGGAPPSAWRWVGMIAAAGFAAVLTIWGSYGFRYEASLPGPLLDPSTWQTDGGIFARLLECAYHRHLLPEAFLFAIRDAFKHNQNGHGGFALGRHSNLGWWWYYPFAFLVKNPVPSLVLMGWGVVAGIRTRPVTWNTVCLLVPGVFFGAVLVLSNVNIGLRYWLPVFPFLWTLAGGVARIPTGNPSSPAALRLAGLLLACTVACTAAAAPDFLSYFNLPSTIISDRHHMLVDSNLDWGQDLARLKEYMDRKQIPEIKLGYFGTGSPRQLGLRHQVLPGYAYYVDYEPEWIQALGVDSGDIVAVSATVFEGVCLNDPGYYARTLQDLKPIDQIGHSILIFKIP